MQWRGREVFLKLLEVAGYDASTKGPARFVAALGEVMDKPPSVVSIRTACLSKEGRGFKKPGTRAAFAAVLKCKEADLYEAHSPPSAPPHVSTWDWIRSGSDVESRKSWPI